MTTLIERFIPEARGYLESAAAGLLKLERNPGDEALVNEVFRAFHTLKGSSGLFEIPGLTRLVHAGEDLLVAVREDALTVKPELVDLLLDSLDWVAKWVDALETEHRLPENADGISASLSLRLRALLPSAPSEVKMAVAAAAHPDRLPSWVDEVPASVSNAIAARAQSCGQPLFAVSYAPDEGCFFRGEDPINLILQLEGLLALDIRTAEAGPVADIDPFRCSATFYAITAQPRVEIEHLFRYVLEHVIIHQLPSDFKGAPSTIAETAPQSDDVARRLARRILNEQLRILRMPVNGGALRQRVAAVQETVASIMTKLGAAGASKPLDDAAHLAANGDTGALCKLLSERIGWLEDGVASTAPAQPSQPLPASPPAPAVAAEAKAVPAEQSAAAGETKVVGKVLKVDQAKVDVLMNLIGELVVTKNSLPYLAERAETDYGSREMSREIKDQYAVIDRLATEMQRALMNIRLLPVSEIFDRFPRLVRDLSRKLDKHITLVVEGEETSVDKNIIEALADPLIHLVRNAIDHGIETPSVRASLGKPETATISLKASQDGDQVIIEVTDDGKGIDPVQIRAKAVEKGLIAHDQAAAMDDAAAMNLVFLPGFSTAAQISDLSGRGVGMDVVRNAIEKVNGQINLTSQPGSGTTVRLALPLSMVITRVMMVEVGDGLYGLPMDCVIETVRIPASAISKIKSAEAFVHRGALVPIVRLGQLLQADADRTRDADEVALVVAKIGSMVTALAIDKFRGNIEVILKPLDGILSRVTAFAGSALLGDGRVLLVLNLKEVLR